MGKIAHLSIRQDGDAPLPAYMEREQQAAVRDLIASAHFQPVNDAGGPYDVALSLEDHRLVLRINAADGTAVHTMVLALKPYRRLIQDYFMMIESYEEARRSASPAKLEAIDMGRRGLHNEGASLLQERLKDKVEMDHETARRFFTLVCALHKTHLRMMG